MIRNDTLTVWLVSLYFFVYCILLQFEATLHYAMIMMPFAPFLLCVMIYVILKHGKYTGKELGENEFGYQDKEKNDLGVF